MLLRRFRILLAFVLLCVGHTAHAAEESDADARAAVVEAAADLGCVVDEPARDIKALDMPLDHILQVKCADSHIIWFHKVDGEWTLRPLG